jgi:hypothetical protein
MTEKLAADLAQGLEASKGVPSWLLILILLGSPGLAATVTGSWTGDQMRSAIEQLKAELKEEVNARMAFEEKCQVERANLEDRLMEFRLEQQRLQLTVQQMSDTQRNMLDKMGMYQTNMTDLVRSILGRVESWKEEPHPIVDFVVPSQPRPKG